MIATVARVRLCDLLIGIVGPSLMYQWNLRCEEGMEACWKGTKDMATVNKRHSRE